MPLASFLQRKLAPTFYGTAATKYGLEHEQDALSAYRDYCRKQGKAISIHPCGVVVDKCEPWLAASPDGLVRDPFNNEGETNGCVEVKCPIKCKSMTIPDAAKTDGFCLIFVNGVHSLSKTHAYYYQVQTQLHVTKLQWCDFVVWSAQDL